MPLQPLNREQTWLFPPALDELLPREHPARFVAEFVDGLGREGWGEMEIGLEGDPLGAAAYHPRRLLSVWVYGFMTGVRSSRKLEAACRDQIPYLWLTGRQHPDHNTLWRFYKGHREAMRRLFKRTVRTAVRLGLVDLAVQAVDGTKVMGNAAKERTYEQDGLAKLLERTETAIGDLEAQNEGGEDPPPPRLPQKLHQAEVLREQVREAMAQLAQEEGKERINLSDPEANLMKSRQGIVAGYNAQAMVSPLDPAIAHTTGLFITAADVVDAPDDHGQLAPMLDQAEEMTGQPAKGGSLTLADGGYHSGSNLEMCLQRGQRVIMPEAQQKALKRPYHKEHFVYHAAADTYTCPQGQTLRFSGNKERSGRLRTRMYRASGEICRQCPAFGECTKDRRQGRGWR